MHALYTKQSTEHELHFEFIERVALFGCNRGFIPRYLRSMLPAGESEPYSWRIDLEPALEADGRVGQTFVIDLKPNNTKPNLSFYEIVRVWGVSASGWTPIMMQLRMLFGDDDRDRVVDGRFVLSHHEIDEPIFSLMYLNGSVEDGSLIGKWTTPGPSPTNAVLLWPDTFDYFSGEMAEVRRKLSEGQV